MDLRQSISHQTEVSLSMVKHLSSIEAKESNFAFSPLSIHVVLGLIAAGSAGETLAELLTFLKSESSDQLHKLSADLVSLVFADGAPVGGPKLSFVNGVWIDQSLQFRPSFKQTVDDVYKAASNRVDFQNKAPEVTFEVNSWAEKETSGLIKDLLPPDSVDHMTRLVLANALYFKGAWDEKFDASKSKEHDFHVLNGSSVKVPFMTSKKKHVIGTFDDFKVLSLGYKRGEDKRSFSMSIFLPDARDGLSALAEKMSSVSGFLDKHLPHEKVDVGDFRIPRFKISFGLDGSNLLKGLGVAKIFHGGLTEMVDSTEVGNKLCVSNIFHKSLVEVNEEGTEAAAASAVVVSLRSIRFENKVDFVADHPFLFVIREDVTGVVLFAGQVVNPLLVQ
ncbi:hypothetical protein Dimus_002349 [Dionaea muscipula]